MGKKHHTPIIFAEQTEDLRQRTLKFHRDFYNSTGIYKDEVAYKLCKCTNLPLKTTRAELYIHSVEASHYPLIACPRCGVLMEREDSMEHSVASCDPCGEGDIFLVAMERQIAIAKAKKQKGSHLIK
mmetsp:Transcript_22325/g.26148  ORF Transcript_22325/g.26148 Transcript_22325/m.26148 type:complete len:127 (-) Transcript_22325:196-576(-)|eukprot:CAMPEP_0185607566 /NCGR_PEP_ID=MMETSP0436-20130131/5601_1 /TAXON_ID=626734 ORGANISM="Favella taraikaensis, Strain Fe Narragansett Bay" /NCGR_SAMPLE_ID=MMETSP0436 /ASSEMBLY_ACC=CAM_ASM_000390 /LENGTH=126 /DNA_ID=CAMNT_0028239533 /DNA_START=621 /DNA_END=1001 /DNA_ORIENTATION=+